MNGLIHVEIPSQTKPRHFYKVRKTNVGWRCDCPAFVFSKNDHCKHIPVAESMYQDYIGHNADN